MSELTADQRKAMPQSEYALPRSRFPIPDASHARAALSGASRAANVGNITPAQKAEVDAKAKAKLHPRNHALAMASAEHLHRSGYISSAQHAQIRAKASGKLASGKAPPKAFGALG